MEPPAGTRLVVLPLRWHEAVALVREVADALQAGSLHAVPAAADLLLAPDGAVQVAGRVGGSRPGSAGDSAAGLRRLLREVIEPAAPPELRALLDREAEDESPEDFVSALSYFERPGRQADLRALAGQQRLVEEQRRLESEVDRLVHKARAEEHRHPAPGVDSESKPTSPRRGALKGAVTLLAVAAGVGALAVALVMALSDDPLRATRAVAGHGAGLVTTLREAARSAFRAQDARSAAAAQDPVTRRPAATKRTPPRRHLSSARRMPSAAAAVVAPVEVFRAPEPEFVEVPLDFSTVSPMPAPSRRDDVYDRTSPQVSPARLLRPHLPTVPPERAGNQFGMLEVLVAADGRVERVRLLATTAERRYHDAMLLAAVKAWVFRPAELNGEPVRYRLQIPLT